jgi:hypothetical protein
LRHYFARQCRFIGKTVQKAGPKQVKKLILGISGRFMTLSVAALFQTCSVLPYMLATLAKSPKSTAKNMLRKNAYFGPKVAISRFFLEGLFGPCLAFVIFIWG